MRLFTGISLSDEVVANLARLRHTTPLNWSPDENLHITTKFIGECPEGQLEELQEVLAGIPRGGTIGVAVERLDFYPNAARPRILFAAVRAPQALTELARATETALEPAGFPREDRLYSPHVTLARVGNADFPKLHETIASMSAFQFGSFEATEFHLFLSKPGRGGSVYTKLASYPLA